MVTDLFTFLQQMVFSEVPEKTCGARSLEELRVSSKSQMDRDLLKGKEDCRTRGVLDLPSGYDLFYQDNIKEYLRN